MAVAGQPCIGLQVQVGWNVAFYAKTYFLFQTVKKNNSKQIDNAKVFDIF